MRAVTQDSFGDPAVLHVVEVPNPPRCPPRCSSGCTPPASTRSTPWSAPARFPMLGQPPFVLGWDVSGVVEEVVPGVTRFEVGDEVYGMPFFPRAGNAYAEYVAVPSRQLARKPAAHRPRPRRRPAAGRPHRLAGLVDTAGVSRGRSAS